MKLFGILKNGAVNPTILGTLLQYFRLELQKPFLDFNFIEEEGEEVSERLPPPERVQEDIDPSSRGNYTISMMTSDHDFSLMAEFRNVNRCFSLHFYFLLGIASLSNYVLVEQARGTDGGPESMRGLLHLIGTAGLIRVLHGVLIEILLLFMLGLLFLDRILSIIPTIECYKLWAQNIHDTFATGTPP